MEEDVKQMEAIRFSEDLQGFCETYVFFGRIPELVKDDSLTQSSSATEQGKRTVTLMVWTTDSPAGPRMQN